MPKRSSQGLLTNADRDLRMSPGERAYAAGEDFNAGLIEEGERRANVVRFAKQHKPTTIRLGMDRVTADMGDGSTLTVDEVTPQWIMDMDEADVRELRDARLPLPVTAWCEDPTWPFRMRPVMNNEHFWGAIFDGYYCPRCCHPHEEAHPQACATCFLPKTTRDKLMDYLEELGMIHSGSGDPAGKMRNQLAAAAAAEKAGGGAVGGGMRRLGSGLVIPSSVKVPTATPSA